MYRWLNLWESLSQVASRQGAGWECTANCYAHAPMSLAHLTKAVENGDDATLLRYVRLHVGDGNAEAGIKEINKAWVVALKALITMPQTGQQFIDDTLKEQDHETLAHLFFRLHFYLVSHSGEWIHDGHV